MMKMKLKRFLACGLVAAMTLALVACGNNANTDANDDQNQENQNQEDQNDNSEDSGNVDEQDKTYSIFDPEEELVKITLGNQTTINEQANGDTILDNMFMGFMKDAFNIEYEFEIEGTDEYLTNLSLAVASGDLPDVFQVRDTATMNELVENGLIMDVTELYEKYTTDYIKAAYDATDYDHFAIVTYDDAIYAVPRANNIATRVLWIRQDWVDKLELTVDEDGNGLLTLDEVEMLASEFKTNDPGNSGDPVGMVGLYRDLFSAYFGAYEGYWYQAEDGSYVNGATVPGMKDALTWYSDMYAKGLLDPQYGITKSEDVQSMIANSQLGILSGDANAPTYLWTDAYTLDAEMDWKAYGLDNGDGLQNDAAPNYQGRYMCISSECENPDAAMKLILLDLTFQIATAYDGGVEEALPAEVLEWIQNDHSEFYEQYLISGAPCTFKRISPCQFSSYNAPKLYLYYYNVMDYEAGILSRDQLTPTVLAYVEGMEHIEDGTAEPGERMKVDELDGRRAQMPMQDNKVVNWQVIPVQVSTDTTAMYDGDLSTMIDEMVVKIITGEESIDYFDTFVEKYYQSGGDAIAKEYEEAYK